MAAARAPIVHTAAELGAPFGKSGEWVTSRTGITALRRLGADESIEDLALQAGNGALERAALSRAVDMVITASCSRPADQGRAIAQRLAPHAAWFDINSACSGFSYALAAADTCIRTGSAEAVLIVASEHMSRMLDRDDLATSIIFGDGAGAAVVSSAAEPGVGPLVGGSDGAGAELIANDEGGRLRMAGRSVFRWAVETVPRLALDACTRAGLSLADIDVFVPHQANLRIVEAIARKLGLDRALVATDVTASGNTSAASIPLALDTLLEGDPALGGCTALLVGFGAGLSYAAQVVRLPTTISASARSGT